MSTTISTNKNHQSLLPPLYSSSSSSAAAAAASASARYCLRRWFPLLLSHLLIAMAAFHVGFTMRMNLQQQCSPSCCDDLQQQPNFYGESRYPTYAAAVAATTTTTNQTTSSQQQQQHLHHHDHILILPTKTIEKMIVGMARVKRDDFARMFDVGIPLVPSTEGNEDVLLLYTDATSLPNTTTTNTNTNTTLSQLLLSSSSSSSKLLSSPQEATQRCLSMNVIMIEPQRKHHCVAIMGQRSPPFMMYKWMRVVDRQWAAFGQPLRMVSRTRQRSKMFIDYPNEMADGFANYIQDGLASLETYLRRLGPTLERLRPLALQVSNSGGGSSSTIAGDDGIANNNINTTNNNNNTKHYKNTIIVMLCNHGQSELLLNFVCSARARGLDTSQVLVFAMDVKTKELAQGMGLYAFYDEQIFGNLPHATPSQRFGDETFKRLMLAKVYCLHLISTLQYNILFQDADVMWYKHPLDFFTTTTTTTTATTLQPDDDDFDIYFSDDGSRTYRHEPYHANGGFFYIRYNKRTAYFVSSLMRHGDFILKKNEQIVMNVLLQEHASLTGLRTKTIPRERTEFLGGWHFHSAPNVMKQLMSKISNNITRPYIFHMSWTGNKMEKLHYLEQMGYLFVSDQCIGDKMSEIMQQHSNNNKNKNNNTKSNSNSNHTHSHQHVTSACCMAKPIVRCHYSDKPSKIPCRESPPIGLANVSFW